MEEIIKMLHLKEYEVIKDSVGRSSSNVFRLELDGEVLFLKVGGVELKNLATILQFLSSTTIQAPRLQQYGVYQNQHYVLMTECVGMMSYELEPSLAVKILARELKKIHSIPYPEDIIVMDTRYYKEKILAGDVSKLHPDDIDFVSHIEELQIQDDLVFSHGDYCLPNVLFDQGVTSIIDLDHACVTFRYADILDCFWSMEYNFKTKKYESLFLEEYGISNIDRKNMEQVKRIFEILNKQEDN